MSTAAASIETSKLAKLLRLIFGSDRDGEIVAAVKRLLAASDLDAHWLAEIVERGTSPSAPSISPDAQGDDRSLVWFAWHRRDRLSVREAAFIESLTRWRGTISERQRVWLHDIVDRLAEVASA
jgi:hypothetical protein